MIFLFGGGRGCVLFGDGWTNSFVSIEEIVANTSAVEFLKVFHLLVAVAAAVFCSCFCCFRRCWRGVPIYRLLLRYTALWQKIRRGFSFCLGFRGHAFFLVVAKNVLVVASSPTHTFSKHQHHTTTTAVLVCGLGPAVAAHCKLHCCIYRKASSSRRS